MYREEKQENKPSVVELGVLCVPWVLRSSGMTAVSWYPAAHCSHGTPINRCMSSFQKKTGFNPPNLFSILATLDPFPLTNTMSSDPAFPPPPPPEKQFKARGRSQGLRYNYITSAGGRRWYVILCMVNCPASLASLFIPIIWCSRPYKHMILSMCHCHHDTQKDKYTNTQWFKDPTHAVFLIRGFKDI